MPSLVSAGWLALYSMGRTDRAMLEMAYACALRTMGEVNVNRPSSKLVGHEPQM